MHATAPTPTTAAPATHPLTRKQLLAQLRRQEFAAAAAIAAASEKTQAIGRRRHEAHEAFTTAANEARSAADEEAILRFDASQNRDQLEQRIRAAASPEERAGVERLARDVKEATRRVQTTGPTAPDAAQLQARQDRATQLAEARRVLEQLWLANEPLAEIAKMRAALRLEDSGD